MGAGLQTAARGGGMRTVVRVGWAGCLGLVLLLAGACGPKKVEITPEEVNQAVTAAQAAYRKLMELNPPQTLEYQSRVLLKQAEDALEKKDFEDAKAKAGLARQQAEMAYQARAQMIEETKKRLDKAKGELELMYFPGVDLIAKYWDARDNLYGGVKEIPVASVYGGSGEKTATVAQKVLVKIDYDHAKQLVDQLEPAIAKEKQFSVGGPREISVWAPEDDVHRFGWPRLYENIRSDCTLANVVDTVEVGKRVAYIRMFLCNRQRTFYFVENSKTGRQGWMAERYVSQARAEKH